MLVEVELQFLVAKVNAQLLERVLFKGLKPENVQNANDVGVTLRGLRPLQRLVDFVDDGLEQIPVKRFHECVAGFLCFFHRICDEEHRAEEARQSKQRKS